jgi:hypothetical protein
LDGIDIDVQTRKEPLGVMQTLITQLKKDFGKDFIITLAPVASAMSGTHNLSGFNYSVLEEVCGDDIDWYNVLFYNGYGSMKDTTGYTNIITRFPLDPSKVVATTLTNEKNGSGWVELDTVKSTMRQLLQMYGHRFGGIAGWEYYNSQPDSDEPWTWAAVMQAAMVNWKEVLAAN